MKRAAGVAIRFGAVLLAAGAAVAAALPASAAEPGITISGLRQEAGLVEFYLSAQDLPAGTALDRVGVTVGERALPVTSEQISVAQGATAPRRAVVLVLDTSGSMAGAPLTAARAAARRYVQALPADVEIAVVTAGAPAVVVLPPTRDRAAAGRALDRLAAKGETALYDGVRAAAGLVGKGEWGQRRIVALSDGADTASKATLAVARRAAAAIPVDTIAFTTPAATANILAGLSKETGGTAYTVADPAALGVAFEVASGSFAAQLLVRVTVPADLAGQEVRFAVSAAGARTEVPVSLAVDTGATVPLVGVDSPGPGPTWLLVLGGLVFAALLGAFLLVVSPMLAAAERRRRLTQVDQFVAAPRRAAAQADSTGQVAGAALALSEQVMKSANAEGRLATQLDRAGMRLRPHEWLLLRALVCLITGLLLAMSAGLGVGVVFGPPVGWVLTSLYHRNRAAKRVSAFRELLPDALQLIVGSLRSGFSLAQAVDAMARELPDPIAAEFGRALGETRLGVDIEDALDRVATRMRSKDLAWAVVAIRVQRDVGGNLAEVLTTTIETMRERETLHREVSSLSAEGRLSAWILLALPVGIGGFMFLTRAEYIRPLYTHPAGIVMSVLGVLLVIGGGFWLLKMIKIEV